jgi:hypothetical protein
MLQSVEPQVSHAVTTGAKTDFGTKLALCRRLTALLTGRFHLDSHAEPFDDDRCQ